MERVVVRGGGDIATGTIVRLHNAGFKVLITEADKPTAIRRKVSLCEAVYQGKATVEGATGVYIPHISQMQEIWNRGNIPIIIDPSLSFLPDINPFAIVDAILAKKNYGMQKTLASVTIALGPGFEAGKDVQAVIETSRGHNLGRIIYKGKALENTGIPGSINGYTRERVLYSPIAGKLKIMHDIGEIVQERDVIAYVEDAPIAAPIAGVIRGMIRDGFRVTEGLKIADIDPRISERENCYTISDKARNIAGSVLEALLYLRRNHG